MSNLKIVTPERYVLLQAWGDWASVAISPPKQACFATGVVGLLLAELPENHIVFTGQPLESFDALLRLVAEYSDEAIKSLQQAKGKPPL